MGRLTRPGPAGARAPAAAVPEMAPRRVMTQAPVVLAPEVLLRRTLPVRGLWETAAARGVVRWGDATSEWMAGEARLTAHRSCVR